MKTGSRTIALGLAASLATLAIVFAVPPASADGTPSPTTDYTVVSSVERPRGDLGLWVGEMHQTDKPQFGQLVRGYNTSGTPEVLSDDSLTYWRLEINGLKFSLFCMGYSLADGTGYVNFGFESTPVYSYGGDCRLTDYHPATELQSGRVSYWLERHNTVCEPGLCDDLEGLDETAEFTDLFSEGWSAMLPEQTFDGFNVNSLDPANYATGALFGCYSGQALVAFTGCGHAKGEALAFSTNGGDVESKFIAVALNGGDATCDNRYWVDKSLGLPVGTTKPPTYVIRQGWICVTAPTP